MLVNDNKVEVQSFVPIQLNEKESKENVSKNKIKYIALGVFGTVALAGIYYGRNYMNDQRRAARDEEFDSCSSQCKVKSEAFLQSYGKKIEQSNEAVKNAKTDNERTIVNTARSQLRIRAGVGFHTNKEDYNKCTSECIANYKRV